MIGTFIKATIGICVILGGWLLVQTRWRRVHRCTARPGRIGRTYSAVKVAIVAKNARKRK